MPQSPYDPGSAPPSTLRGRIGHHLRRAIEPLALDLVDWCRSLDGRVGGLAQAVHRLGDRLELQGRVHEEALKAAVDAAEGRADLVAGLLDRVDVRVDHVEGRLAQAERRLEQAEGRLVESEGRLVESEGRHVESEGRHVESEGRLVSLEERADVSYWGREALVERLNATDARDEILVDRLAAAEEAVDRLNWGREALVERLNATDARAETLVGRLERLADRVDEHVPMPLAFAMDALAMGRRLAALEDQVERLTRPLAGDGDAAGEGGPSVVGFPCLDKAAG